MLVSCLEYDHEEELVFWLMLLRIDRFTQLVTIIHKSNVLSVTVCRRDAITSSSHFVDLITPSMRHHPSWRHSLTSASAILIYG